MNSKSSYIFGTKTTPTVPCLASLQTKLPRMARVGDEFEGGSVVTMTNPAFIGDVTVRIKLTPKDKSKKAPLTVCAAAVLFSCVNYP